VKAPAVGTRKQAILAGVLGIVLLFAVVKWSGREKTVAPPPAAPAAAERRPPALARGARSRTRAVAPDEIPLLTERDLDPGLRGAGSDTGRDLFDFREPTPTPPKMMPLALPRSGMGNHRSTN